MVYSGFLCALCLAEENADSTSPLVLDFRASSAYHEQLASIEPTGFFAVGRRYTHAPRAEWTSVNGTDHYDLLLVQGNRLLGVTHASASPHFIEHGWDDIQPGKAKIVIQAFDASGKRIGMSRLLPFYVAPPFDPARSSAQRRPYREAAQMAFDALYTYQPPPATPAPTDGPGSHVLPILLGCTVSGLGLAPYSFPVLHDWEHVDMLVTLSKHADDALKARIMTYAQSVRDHLLMSRLPAEGNRYGGMIRGCVDHQGEPALGYWVADAAQRAKLLRLVEPAKNGYAGEALVKLFEITGDQTCLDAAIVMADVYAQTQAEDGSWPARVDGKTGEVLASYSSCVGSVASFLNRLQRHRPDPRYAEMERRARDWMMQHPMTSYGWVVNYDDGQGRATLDDPYQGLSNWDLFCFMRYLCRIGDAVPNVVERITEQMNWNDNQFVFYGSDPLLPFEPFVPSCAEQGNPQSYGGTTDCWVPMDFHTANWVRTLLDVYRLTGDAKWLALAKAGGNTMTQYQLDNGRTITWMPDRATGLSVHEAGNPALQSFWPAAWALSASAFAELADATNP